MTEAGRRRGWIRAAIAATLVSGCADPSTAAEGGETSAGTTSVSGSVSGSESDGESGGTGGVDMAAIECPAPDPEFDQYFFYLGDPDWPYAPLIDPAVPPTEHCVCSIVGIDKLADPHVGEYLEVSFDCLHEDGQHYPQTLVLRWTASHEAALAGWAAVEPLELRFMDSKIWDEHLDFLFLSVRDANDRLLFAGLHSTPASLGDGGAALGVPPGDDFASWYAPFSSFTLDDPGCEPVDVDREDYLGIADRVRRLAVDVELDGQVVTLHDKSSALGIEAGDGRFDLFVGQAFEILETGCGDCLPIYVHVHALRQGD